MLMLKPTPPPAGYINGFELTNPATEFFTSIYDALQPTILHARKQMPSSAWVAVVSRGISVSGDNIRLYTGVYQLQVQGFNIYPSLTITLPNNTTFRVPDTGNYCYNMLIEVEGSEDVNITNRGIGTPVSGLNYFQEVIVRRL